MQPHKTAALNTVILQYLAKCIDEGDLAAISELGLQQEDAEAVARLRLAEIDNLSVCFPLLRPLALDRNLLRRLIDKVLQDRESKRIRNELLIRDAPQPMMYKYYGMDAAEYASLGWQLRVRRCAGRPSMPSDEEMNAVWKAYVSIGSPPDLTPHEWLRLCELTSLTARAVYVTLQQIMSPKPSISA